MTSLFKKCSGLAILPSSAWALLMTVGTLTQNISPATAEEYQVQPRDALLSNYDYPYKVRFHDLNDQQQSLRMAYMDVAPRQSEGTPPQAKGTVLLLHGKNFSGAYWQQTIDALTAKGYRVIAPDQIGFGKSSKPTRFQFSFQSLAEHTRSLLDTLDVEKVYVAGHSMGGMLATRFALMHPDRAKKLVLINPIGLEDWKRVVPYQSIDGSIAQEEQQTPAIVKAYMTKAYFDGHWKPEYNPLLDIQGGWSIGPDADKIAVIDALTSDMVFTQPVLYEFEDLKMPTLLIIGTRDRTAIGKNRAAPTVQQKLGLYGELGKITAKKIPNAELVELNGVGHVPQYEAFQAYVTAFSGFIER
ncbi:alpha/beta fold hydrolase [Microbulbifer aggregans]|uniref:alpha/beta fold hydrolase n=1 Tax=Microbulbifer aggregans TaxID=1769779 RepID=UPI001CFDE5D9|nr:alpha/beta hydrolase [Microbulbifer aggregans]